MRADLAFGTAEAMATNQVIDWQRKEGGGEGGIVRGCTANPPLRSGPTRARRRKSRSDLVEPSARVSNTAIICKSKDPEP